MMSSPNEKLRWQGQTDLGRQVPSGPSLPGDKQSVPPARESRQLLPNTEETIMLSTALHWARFDDCMCSDDCEVYVLGVGCRSYCKREWR